MLRVVVVPSCYWSSLCALNGMVRQESKAEWMIERNRAPRFVGVFPVNARGELLLQLRDNRPELYGPGTWSTLGGAIEPGETPEACARRELEEETGRRPDRVTPVAVVHRMRPDRPVMYEFHLFALAVNWTLDDVLLCEGQGLAWIPSTAVAALALNELIERDMRTFAAARRVRSLAAAAPPWRETALPPLPPDLPVRLGVAPGSLVFLHGATARFAEQLRPLLPDGARQTATPGAQERADVALWWPRGSRSPREAWEIAGRLNEGGRLWLCGADSPPAGPDDTSSVLAAVGLAPAGIEPLPIGGEARARLYVRRAPGAKTNDAGR